MEADPTSRVLVVEDEQLVGIFPRRACVLGLRAAQDRTDTLDQKAL